MDFEQALFRVYDRSMDGLLQDRPLVVGVPQTKPRHMCTLCMHALWFIGLSMITAIIGLHANFVNDPGCLKTTMQTMMEENSPARRGLQAPPTAADNGTAPLLPDPKNVSTWLAEDEVLQIRIQPSELFFASGGASSNNRGATAAAVLPGATPPDTTGNDDDGNSTAPPLFEPDYIFVKDAPLLYFEPAFYTKHNIKRVNVTLDDMCVTKGPGLGFVLDGVVGNYDTIMINQLMFTFRSDGVMRNTRTNETWSWRATALPPVGGRSWFDGLSTRLGALLQALTAFFFLSGVTAIVVRMLMTSGVALMYPLFFCMRRMGVTGLNFRVLTASYSWLGVPLERLRARRKPLAPFILAHLARVVIVYVMYEAAQIFFVETLYSKSMPSGLPFAIYGIIMLTEYFLMCYVRSALSIRYFPRVAALYLLCFHLYFYLIPFGFYNELLLAIALLLLHAMLYTIVFLELPAYRSSIISYETPRAYYTDTGLPAHPNAIPPSWSLFLPLTMGGRQGGGTGDVYAEEVPDRPVGGPGLGGRLHRLIVEMEEGRRQRRRQQRGEAEAEAGGVQQEQSQQPPLPRPPASARPASAPPTEGRGGEGNTGRGAEEANGGQQEDSIDVRVAVHHEAGEEDDEEPPPGQNEGSGLIGRRRGYRRLSNDDRL